MGCNRSNWPSKLQVYSERTKHFIFTVFFIRWKKMLQLVQLQVTLQLSVSHSVSLGIKSSCGTHHHVLSNVLMSDHQL
jgi:hypothetical protein